MTTPSDSNHRDTFDETLLSAYLDDELDAKQRRLVEQHLAHRADLRDTLGKLRQVRKQLDLLRRSNDPSPQLAPRVRAALESSAPAPRNDASLSKSQSYSARRYLAITATVAVAAIGMILLLLPLRGTNQVASVDRTDTAAESQSFSSDEMIDHIGRELSDATPAPPGASKSPHNPVPILPPAISVNDRQPDAPQTERSLREEGSTIRLKPDLLRRDDAVDSEMAEHNMPIDADVAAAVGAESIDAPNTTAAPAPRQLPADRIARVEEISQSSEPADDEAIVYLALDLVSPSHTEQTRQQLASLLASNAIAPVDSQRQQATVTDPRFDVTEQIGTSARGIGMAAKADGFYGSTTTSRTLVVDASWSTIERVVASLDELSATQAGDTRSLSRETTQVDVETEGLAQAIVRRRNANPRIQSSELYDGSGLSGDASATSPSVQTPPLGQLYSYQTNQAFWAPAASPQATFSSNPRVAVQGNANERGGYGGSPAGDNQRELARGSGRLLSTSSAVDAADGSDAEFTRWSFPPSQRIRLFIHIESAAQE